MEAKLAIFGQRLVGQSSHFFKRRFTYLYDNSASEIIFSISIFMWFPKIHKKWASSFPPTFKPETLPPQNLQNLFRFQSTTVGLAICRLHWAWSSRTFQRVLLPSVFWPKISEGGNWEVYIYPQAPSFATGPIIPFTSTTKNTFFSGL